MGDGMAMVDVGVDAAGNDFVLRTEFENQGEEMDKRLRQEVGKIDDALHQIKILQAKLKTLGFKKADGAHIVNLQEAVNTAVGRIETFIAAKEVEKRVNRMSNIGLQTPTS